MIGLALTAFNALGSTAKIGLIIGLAVMLAGLYGTWHYHVWSNGYADAIAAIARQDAKAIKAGQEARSAYRNCVDNGGMWVQSTGKCNRG